MDLIKQIREKLADRWIPDFYREHIRTARTRSFKMDIPERENRPTIHETLLGMEIKVGSVRIYCPDEGTARYVSVFAGLGCREIAIPYDITTLPDFADRLEAAWQQTVGALNELTASSSPQVRGKARAGLIRAMRNEIAQIGAGEAMPLFDRSTRQRKT